MADALVVPLGDAVRALRARETLVRLLAPYAWFLGAHLELKRDGAMVVVAVTTSPSDPVQRAAVLARVASHLDGVQLEDRYQKAGNRAERSGTGGDDSK